MKILLLTGLTLLSLVLATTSNATGTSLDDFTKPSSGKLRSTASKSNKIPNSTTGKNLKPIKSSDNLGSIVDLNPKSAPITPAPSKDNTENTSTQANCPKPISGQSYSCSGSSSWGTTPAARDRAKKAAEAAND